MSLLEEVLKKGFMREEFQHAAVCVEARPATAVADAAIKDAVTNPPRSSLPVLAESFEAYNTRKAMSDDALAECFTDTKSVIYGREGTVVRPCVFLCFFYIFNNFQNFQYILDKEHCQHLLKKH